MGHRLAAVIATRTDPSVFGSELRRWRTIRRYSQEELALRAGVSQRHLSFLENGRSRPSTEMVTHLSIVLEIPLRARNGLLTAAGFAPSYTDEALDGPRLAELRTSLEGLASVSRSLDRDFNNGRLNNGRGGV